jgi:hypothetical protein
LGRGERGHGHLRSESGQPRRFRPHRHVEFPRVVGQCAGCTCSPVGRRLVRMDLGARLKHASEHRLLPPLSASHPHRQLGHRRVGRDRGRPHLAGDGAARSDPGALPDRDRAGPPAGERRCQPDGIRPLRLLPVGCLHGGPVPGSLGGHVLSCPAWSMGAGRDLGRAGLADSDHGCATDRACPDHVPVPGADDDGARSCGRY